MRKLGLAAVVAASVAAAGCSTYPDEYGYSPYGYNNGYYGNGYYNNGYYGNGYANNGYYNNGYYGNGYANPNGSDGGAGAAVGAGGGAVFTPSGWGAGGRARLRGRVRAVL